MADITAVSRSACIRNAGDETLSKNPLIEKISQYIPEHPEIDMDKLLFDIFKMLKESEEEAGKLAEKVAFRERAIRDDLTAQIQNHKGSIREGEKAKDFFKKLSNLAFPLALVGEGIATMVIQGGPSPTSVACVAAGGVLALDVLLDDSMKMSVASNLSRVTGEDKNAWMERISAFVGIATFGLSAVTTGSQAITLVSRVSQLALTCGQTGAELYLNKQKATMTEQETEWEISGKRVQKWLGHLQNHLSSSTHLFDLLKGWSDSSQQTLAKIFA